MSEVSRRYAQALFQLTEDEKPLKECMDLIVGSKELTSVFHNPTISKAEKNAIIDIIFCMEQKVVIHFLKVLCEHGHIEQLSEIYEEYHRLRMDKNGVGEALLVYTFLPTLEQQDEIKKFICKKQKKGEVILRLKEDKSILGGITLQIDGVIYDRSIKGALLNMKNYLQLR